MLVNFEREKNTITTEYFNLFVTLRQELANTFYAGKLCNNVLPMNNGETHFPFPFTL